MSRRFIQNFILNVIKNVRVTDVFSMDKKHIDYKFKI